MDTYDAISGRHGVLHFNPDPIPPEVLAHILEAAIAAPTPANTQHWDFVVVDDPALTKQVARYLVEAQAQYVFKRLLEMPDDFTDHLMRLFAVLENAPVFIIICHNPRVDLADRETFGRVLRDWDMCAIGGAMANLMTMATAYGLGTRYFGGFAAENDAAGMRELLGLPAHVEPIAATPLGYHDEPSKDRPEQTLATHRNYQRGDKYSLAALLKGKLPPRLVTHFNRYEEKTDEA